MSGWGCGRWGRGWGGRNDVGVAARVNDPGPVVEDADPEVAGCGTAGVHLD